MTGIFLCPSGLKISHLDSRSTRQRRKGVRQASSSCRWIGASRWTFLFENRVPALVDMV